MGIDKIEQLYYLISTKSITTHQRRITKPMTRRPGSNDIVVSSTLCRRCGGLAALVHAYMQKHAFLQGGVYTASVDQMSDALFLPPEKIRECLEQLQSARLLRDITPEMGGLAHAYVVHPQSPPSQ